MKVKFPDKDTIGKNITNTDYIELRDYFACHAMQGEMVLCPDLGYKKVAERSYEMADAMMEARDA